MLGEYNTGLRTFLSKNFKDLSRSEQKNIFEKVLTKVIVTDRNHLEIQTRPIYENAVTSTGSNSMKSLIDSVSIEDTLSDSGSDGGRDGTRTRGLRRDRPAL